MTPLGFEAKEAEDGLSAIKLIESYKPDIVLLDLIMPNINGKDVIKKVRESNKDLKIIAITASILENEEKENLKQGANSIVFKPFNKNTILEEIGKLLNIDYIYEDERENILEEKIDNESIKELIEKIPLNIISKFKEKLIIVDIKEIKKLNQIIENYSPQLALFFKSLIDNFDFNIILSFLN